MKTDARAERERSVFAELREKWRAMLSGGSAFDPRDPDCKAIINRIDAAASRNWRGLRQSEDRSRLWDDLDDWRNTATLTSNYRRIREMALAWDTHGSGLYRNAGLLEPIVAALDWMYVHHYHPGMEQYGNWWDWHIGVPLQLLDCITLLDDRLSGQQRERYLAAIDYHKPNVPPNSTGANRVWECTIIALRGVLGRDGAKMAEARKELAPVFVYATEKDGFYRDGSYIQHDVFAYTGGYGQSLLQDLSRVMALLDGSPWQLADTQLERVYRWVVDSYAPVMFRGLMMDMTMGRVISRRHAQNHDIGHMIIRAVLRLILLVPAEQARVLKSMAKEWILTDTWMPFFADADINAAVLAKRLLEDAGVPRSGAKVFSKQFANMARVVHARPGFAFAVSMHSARIANYESINRENLRGWHTSDGMTYLYDGDLSQYGDAFWPTVDSFRLPGTTVLRQSEVEANRRSDETWVGGTALLGRYGAAGMALHPYGQTLRARKSWFMFDDEIVALGAGIRAEEGKMAETVVDNRMLDGAGRNRLIVDGTEKPASPGWAETMEDVNWIHLEGNTPDSALGYYFPHAATVQGLRKERSGKWSEINRYDDDEVIFTRHYLTLWIEHGIDPRDGAYAYVLLPNRTAGEVKAFAAEPSIAVLANTADVQAAAHLQLHITGLNFWVDGGPETAGISADRKCSVMVMENPGELVVAVSDPTFRNEGAIHLAINRKARQVLLRDAAVTVESLEPAIRMAIDVSQAYGATYHARFRI